MRGGVHFRRARVHLPFVGTTFYGGNHPLEVIVMLLKSATSLVFATACLTAVAALPAGAQMATTAPPGGTQTVTNGPQADPGDTSPSWSARQNVVQSQRYDKALETNRGFREARMKKECGPITDPQLHQQCLASFKQDEPFSGASTGTSAPRHRTYHSGSGR